MMIMIYVSPITSLERNANRDRSLMPGIVLRTWRDINNNIETYQQAFGDNLVIINNDPKDAEKDFSADDIKMAFIKFKKYDANTDDLIGQITKNVEIKKIDEDFLVDLKIELDDEFSDDEEFEIETE